jgi:hypothetical protein
MSGQAFFLQEHEMGYGGFQLLASQATCHLPRERFFILDGGKEFINKLNVG